MYVAWFPTMCTRHIRHILHRSFTRPDYPRSVATVASPARRSDNANLVVGFVCLVAVTAVGLGFADDGAGAVLDASIGYLPYALLFSLVTPVLVWVARRPQRGILILAGLVPFYGLLIIVPGMPPVFHGWKEVLTLFVWGSSAWHKRGERTPFHKLPKVVQPVLAYLLIGILSAMAVGGLRGIVGLKVDYFWILLAVVVWQVPLNSRDQDRLISILMLDAVLTALFGIAQQTIGHERLVGWGYAYNENVRFTGKFLRSFSTFATPFNFAFFLTFVILVALPYCLEDFRRPRNIAFMCALPIVGLGLALSFVRGAWVALAVGTSYLAIRRFKVLYLLAPFAILALFTLPGQFSESALASGSLQQRQDGWAQNINKAVSAPMGNGIGTTGGSGAKADSVTGTQISVYEPDNQYFKALYELGVFGLWMLVFMLVAVFLESRAAEQVLEGPQRLLALGFSAHMLGAMVAAGVSTWFAIFPNDLYLWFVLSVLLVEKRRAVGK